MSRVNKSPYGKFDFIKVKFLWLIIEIELLWSNNGYEKMTV